MLKLKRFDEAVWYNWPEASGVRLKIRPLSRRKMLELRNESKQGKVAVSMPDEEIQIVDDFNDFIYEWKMFQFCLDDWEGISIDSEEEAKKEDIREAIFDNIALRRFILQKSLEVMSLENKKFEEELKNLLGSQDG
jgi:hypothetical protein